MHLLSQLTDAKMSAFILQSLRQCAPFLVRFPSALPELLQMHSSLVFSPGVGKCADPSPLPPATCGAGAAGAAHQEGRARGAAAVRGGRAPAPRAGAEEQSPPLLTRHPHPPQRVHRGTCTESERARPRLPSAAPAGGSAAPGDGADAASGWGGDRAQGRARPDRAWNGRPMPRASLLFSHELV